MFFFQNHRNMKGTRILINEDLCPGTVEARRGQMPACHDAGSGGHTFFSYRTLVLRDRRPGATQTSDSREAQAQNHIKSKTSPTTADTPLPPSPPEHPNHDSCDRCTAPSQSPMPVDGLSKVARAFSGCRSSQSSRNQQGWCIGGT